MSIEHGYAVGNVSGSVATGALIGSAPANTVLSDTYGGGSVNGGQGEQVGSWL
ncbi:hypothetical protein HZU77_015890 [Neisseriaceae bacterium TC5R-5]|nr:hypothetical protein [Neisseriaceae bacterium TC5R-5]